MKMAMKEDILHIKLENNPTIGDTKSEDKGNSGGFHNKIKSLIIIQPNKLIETPNDQMCLLTLRIIFYRMNPLTG